MSHRNVRYSREMRDQAKKQRKGLFTIDWTDCNGSRSTLQGPAGPKVQAYVKRVLLTAIKKGRMEP